MMEKEGADDKLLPHGDDGDRMAAQPEPVFPEGEEMKETIDQVRGPEDADFSRDGSADSSLGKRKLGEREPESPGQSNPLEPESTITPYAKKERTYYEDMDNDSPSSYPKHVMVPTSERQQEHKRTESKEPQVDFEDSKVNPAPLLTPDSLTNRHHTSYEGPPIYPRQQQYNDVYPGSSYQETDHRGMSSGQTSNNRSEGGPEPSTRPRRWACDYCNVATFLSYEEACAHEEVCARQHGAPHQGYQHHGQQQQQQQQHHHHHHTPYGPPHGGSQPHHMSQQGTGLGALYHASQEVVTPPTPQRHQQGSRWGSRGPPLPVLPHEQGYYRQGYYDQREDPSFYPRHDPYYPQYQGYNYHQQHQGGYYAQPHSQQPYQKRMLLSMPTDSDSLSDRQCYVRAEMCEIFAATDKDVAARHSKGAQKLVLGQVGIRCVHCAHLRPRDRAERAVCYPSSISRIYQTVADMQRFHFEHCREIPKHVQQVYRNLKTTRPRGVGSPQAYWVQSAKSLGLVDTDNGIRFDSDMAKEQKHSQQSQPSDMSIGTS